MGEQEQFAAIIIIKMVPNIFTKLRKKLTDLRFSNLCTSISYILPSIIFPQEFVSCSVSWFVKQLASNLIRIRYVVRSLKIYARLYIVDEMEVPTFRNWIAYADRFENYFTDIMLMEFGAQLADSNFPKPHRHFILFPFYGRGILHAADKTVTGRTKNHHQNLR